MSTERMSPMKKISIYPSLNQSSQHDCLYQFWLRSQGLWLSKLTKVTLSFLGELELQAFKQIHSLVQPEFGIRMAWEYQIKAETGQMAWCVDAMQPGVVFTNKSVTAHSLPAVYDYEMMGNHILITAADGMEERTVLEGDYQRLRELRYQDKLVRRHWENKFSP
jgi:hypothetical protein